jgi:hypothetical protein
LVHYNLEDFMSLKGYSSVPSEDFVAFPHDLDAAPTWRDTQAAPLDPAGVIDAAAILSSPLNSVLKTLLLYAVGLVTAAVKGTPSLAAAADEGYDRPQRLLKLDLERALLSLDPAVVQAGQTLKAALTLGDGSAQTNLTYDREVTFGRQQITLAARADLAPLVHLLNLQPLLAEIQAATERLAVFAGRADQDPSLSAYTRLKSARTQCARIFNAVHLTLQALQGAAATPAARDHISALLAPLEALLTRNPRPAPKVAATQPPSDPF